MVEKEAQGAGCSRGCWRLQAPGCWREVLAVEVANGGGGIGGWLVHMSLLKRHEISTTMPHRAGISLLGPNRSRAGARRSCFVVPATAIAALSAHTVLHRLQRR
jgi:hypothetical protein